MIQVANSVGAAGGGGGGCYEDFRKSFDSSENLRVEQCNVTVTLLNCLHRAKYSWEYKVIVDGDKPEMDWFFVIPFSEGKVTTSWAKDNEGGLQFKLTPEPPDKTRITVKFREKILKNQHYKFIFGYETDNISIVGSNLLVILSPTTTGLLIIIHVIY